MSKHSMLVKGTELHISQAKSDDLAKDLPTAVFDAIHCISTTGISYEPGDQEEIETTTLCSGDFREYVLGMKDPGNLSFEAHFKPSDEIYKKMKAGQGEQRIYKIVFPDGSEFASIGLLKPLGFTGDLGGVRQTSVTIRLSNAPIETAA